MSGFRDITITGEQIHEGLILVMLLCLGVVIGILTVWPDAAAPEVS